MARKAAREAMTSTGASRYCTAMMPPTTEAADAPPAPWEVVRHHTQNQNQNQNRDQNQESRVRGARAWCAITSTLLAVGGARLNSS